MALETRELEGEAGSAEEEGFALVVNLGEIVENVGVAGRTRTRGICLSEAR